MPKPFFRGVDGLEVSEETPEFRREWLLLRRLPAGLY